MSFQCEPLTSDRVTWFFGKNGLPEKIIMPEEFDSVNLLKEPMDLIIEDESGKRLPVQFGEKSFCEVLRKEDRTVVKMHNLEVGGMETLRINFRHDLFNDGVCFTDAFFFGTECNSPKISRFELTANLSLANYETIRFAMPYRPAAEIEGTLVQSAAPERELVPGDDRVIPNGLFPSIGFAVQSSEGPGFFTEFLLETSASAAWTADNTASSVHWHDGNPVLSWNFQTKPAAPVIGPWQWRNRWTLAVRPAPQQRHFPPFAMYHYFDNFKRYPSAQCLQAIADSGADVLVIHENWRSDIQSGGMPIDPKRLKEVIDFAHSHNIRVALYIRGNEPSVIMNRLNWFDELLKPDFDGLYMDYASPFDLREAACEMFPGGSIDFRRYYEDCKMRRNLVKKNGLVMAHTGPMYSCIGMSDAMVNGYISGEGERGLLIRSRFDHLYYSMAFAGPGTLWSAAFPEYGTKEIVPFLAATGQYPHSPLGTQFKTSSLSHPPVPGINDLPFRPLWRLWQLMKGKLDLTVFNDYNSRGIFPKQKDISHYLMFADFDRAVCIYANFSKTETIKVDPSVAWEKTGFPADGKPQTLCMNGKTSPLAGAFELAPFEVAAVCTGEADFDAYRKPFPALCEEGEEYLADLELQKKYRACTGKADKWFLRLSVPDIPITYENSMTIDLYDNRFILGTVNDRGEFHPLGYIGLHGFQKEQTTKEEMVRNGQESPWIDLSEICGKGTTHLAIQSLHRGDMFYVNSPFYSFAELELGKEPGKPEYKIVFKNELENDRAFLHFDVIH